MALYAKYLYIRSLDQSNIYYVCDIMFWFMLISSDRRQHNENAKYFDVTVSYKEAKVRLIKEYKYWRATSSHRVPFHASTL